MDGGEGGRKVVVMHIVMTVMGLELTSGVSVFVVETANRLVQAGLRVTILYSHTLEYKPSQAVTTILGDSLDVLGFSPDLVHVHALWSPFCANAMKWCVKHHVPYVVSLHGSLMPHVFLKGKAKKRLFFELCLRRNLNLARALHATADAEANEARKLNLRAGIKVIPLGVKLPMAETVQKRRSSGEMRTVLFLGRIGREKGLRELLNAWTLTYHDGWRLVLAGPDWLGYKKTLDALIREKAIQGVVFPGKVSGKEKEAWYREADLFVLPSPMENFSAVVLDALAFGIPVVATKGTPWRELEEARCGWWIESGEDSLRAALGKAMSLTDEQRMILGRNGRHIAETRYSWPRVSEALEELYKVVTG